MQFCALLIALVGPGLEVGNDRLGVLGIAVKLLEGLDEGLTC